jgi:uncharacterized protein (TIGR02611 family)
MERTETGETGETSSPSEERVFGRVRGAIEDRPGLRRAYRVSVGVVGTGTVALGIVLMPLPGPGALIAAGGLAILGTEFEKAQKANVVVMKTVKGAARRANEFRQKRADAKNQTGA